MSSVKNNQASVGFTLVEILIIAPIVVLVIGVFVSLMVVMTGEIVATRSQNTLVYNTQSALDQIEQDVKASSEFLAGNDFAPQGQQGYAGSTGAIFSDFENVDATKGTMLVLRTVTTDKNPLDNTRQLIYTNQPAGNCTADTLASNQLFNQNVVYFVKNNTLWRRTLIQQDASTPTLCGTPWQLPSCQPGVTRGSYCKADDKRMLDNVSNSNFSIQYFSDASPSTVVDGEASDTSASDSARTAAVTNDDTVNITLTTQQTVAGRSITQTGALRATKTNTVATP